MKDLFVVGLIYLSAYLCIKASEPSRDIKMFYELAMNATSDSKGYVIDKIKQHRFQEMYGRFLVPHIREARVAGRGYRFLEIGAGCAIPQKKKGMQVWSALLNSTMDKIFVAELKWRCIEKMKREGTVPENIKSL